MQQLKIHCFGYLKIEKDGEVITQFDTDKARVLLVYLAIEHQRPVPRSYLAGLFWSDLSEKQALQSLRQTLSILRKVLGDNGSENPIIQSERDHLRLNPAIPTWVDVLEFKRLLNQAYRHFQRQDQFHQLNFRLLKKALQLRAGDFLEKFSISGAPLFDEWVSIIREDLDHLTAEALNKLVQYYQKRGEFSLAKQTIQRILSITPWSESAHIMMMRHYAMDGQRSSFENQFHLLRKFLKEQIGVEPAPDTIAFYEEVRRHRGKAPLFLYEASTPSKISGGESRFIGREMELDEITNLLVDPSCRLITLHGSGGIGKTSLAMELIRQQAGIYKDGIFFISLAGTNSNEELISALVDSLKIELMDSSNTLSRLRDYLRNKTMLLVLDNFEHLLENNKSTRVLTEVIHHTLNIKILVTSRERLNLKEEWVYPLKGMSYPDRIESDEIESQMKFDALALFYDRARQIQPDFKIDLQSISAVIHICQLLEGLPLGIELAASDVWSQSCQMIATKISNNLNSLNANASNISPRYRSLWANLDASWTLMENHQQEIFIRLGIFEEGISIRAAQTIGLASLDDLTRLVNQSLLQHDKQGQYKMHAVIRQYARERLHDSGFMAETQIAFIDYFTNYLLDRQEKSKFFHQKQALDDIQAEIRNLKEAWEWILERKQTDKIDIFLEPLFQFFHIRSRYQEGMDFFQPGLDLLDQIQAAEPLAQYEIVSGRLLVMIGSLAHRLRQNDKARYSLEKAAQIFKEHSLENDLAICHSALEDVYLRANEFVAAEYIALKNLEYFHAHPDITGEMRALNTMGLINLRQGKLNLARKYLHESVELGRKLEITRQLIVPLNYLGDIACNEGKYSKAVKLFQEGLKIATELEDFYQMAIVINNLASVYHVELDYRKASEMYSRSLGICRQIGDLDGEAIALANLGEVALALGDYTGAISLSNQALMISREIGEEWSISICLNNLADAYCKDNQFENAVEHIKEAILIAWKNEATRFLARFAVTAGRCYQLQGMSELANELFEAALAHSSIEYDIREKAIGYCKEMEIEKLPEPDDKQLGKVIQQFLLTDII